MPTPITPAAVTLSQTSAWESIDATSYNVPSGSSGVICRIRAPGAQSAAGFRRGDSTDTRTDTLHSNRNVMFSIGLDSADDTFDFWRDNSGTALDIVGYYGSEAVFFQNGQSFDSGTSSFTWADIDITSMTAGDSIACFVENRANQLRGLRQNGSTDTNLYPSGPSAGNTIVGVDGDEIFEINTQSNSQTFYVNGYLTDGVTWRTDGVDRALGSTASWINLTALPAAAVMGIYGVVGSTGTGALRKEGSSEDYSSMQPWNQVHIVECDTSQVVEGYISDLSVDFYELGHLFAVAAAPAGQFTSPTVYGD